MTDQLRQAAQQALEALTIYSDAQCSLKGQAAITALRTALAMHQVSEFAQAQQQAEPTCPECKAAVLYECVACSSNNYPPQQQAEPVAWMFQHDETGRMNYVSNDGRHTPDLFLKTNLRYALVCPLYTTSPQQQAETPPEWPLVKNILDEYGLDAISFVAEWKAAQRPWVGLTDEDWEHIDNKKGTALDTFAQGAVWAEVQLRERNK